MPFRHCSKAHVHVQHLAPLLLLVTASLWPLRVLCGAMVFSQYHLPYTYISIEGGRALAMVDTGSQIPLSISPVLAGRIRFKGADTGSRVRGYAFKPLPVLVAPVHDVVAGDLIIGSVQAAVVGDQVSVVSKQVGTPFEAVIGWPLLRRYYARLDYREGTFKLGLIPISHDRATVAIPFAVIQRSLTIEGLIDGAMTRFLVDTGSPNCAIDTSNFGAPANSFKEVLLTLGSATYAASCVGLDLSVNRSTGATAILGEDVFSNGQMYLDPLTKTLWLSPHTV